LEGGETLENVAQKGYVCPACEGIHGQVEWDPGQSQLVSDDPAHGMGFELDNL